MRPDIEAVIVELMHEYRMFYYQGGVDKEKYFVYVGGRWKFSRRKWLKPLLEKYNLTYKEFEEARHEYYEKVNLKGEDYNERLKKSVDKGQTPAHIAEPYLSPLFRLVAKNLKHTPRFRSHLDKETWVSRILRKMI